MAVAGAWRALAWPLVRCLAAGALLAVAVAVHPLAGDQSARDPDTAVASGSDPALLQALHRRLVQEGLLQPAAAAERVAALRRVNDRLGLAVLRYESGETEIAARAGTTLLQRTPMTLAFTPLHEGDVLALLTHLGQPGAGRMTVRECMLVDTRMRGRANGLHAGARFEARCRLDWYTLAGGAAS